MKTVLSTELRLGSLYFPLIVKRTHRSRRALARKPQPPATTTNMKSTNALAVGGSQLAMLAFQRDPRPLMYILIIF